jgi:hypothetical protein
VCIKGTGWRYEGHTNLPSAEASPIRNAPSPGTMPAVARSMVVPSTALIKDSTASSQALLLRTPPALSLVATVT